MFRPVSLSLPFNCLKGPFPKVFAPLPSKTAGLRSIMTYNPVPRSIPRQYKPIKRTFSTDKEKAADNRGSIFFGGLLIGIFSTAFILSENEERTKKKKEEIEKPLKKQLQEKEEEIRRLSEERQRFQDQIKMAELLGLNTTENLFMHAYQACKKGKWELIKDNEQLFTQLKKDGLSLFLYAVEQGDDLNFIDAFIKRNLFREELDSKKNNGLHVAAKHGHTHLIEKLTNIFGTDDTNDHGKTALHLAIEHGHADTVRKLIESGDKRKPFQTKGATYSPTFLAVYYGAVECFKIFVKPTDKFDLQTFEEGVNILHLIVRNNCFQMARYLFANHRQQLEFLLMATDSKGRTPLFLACELGNLAMIQFLKSQGALFELHGTGDTAVHWAVRGRQKEAITLLAKLDAPLQKSNAVREGEDPKELSKKLKYDDCTAEIEKCIENSEALKKQAPNFYLVRPHNLVFKGGGSKGFAYIGALKEMASKGMLLDVERMAGTSAGAITACLLSVGYTVDELEEISEKTDFNDFRDFWKTETSDNSSFDKFKGILSSIKDGVQFYQNPWSKAMEFVQKLYSCTGIYQGIAFRDWIESKIYEKTEIRNCTFGELRQKYLNNREKFKDLYVYACEFNPNQPERPKLICLSAANETNQGIYDSVVISDAIRCSISIPGVFKPHTLKYKDAQGSVYARDNVGSVIDGGLLKNFPLDAFDKKSSEWGATTNRKTLGLSLNTVYGDGKDKPVVKMDSILDVAKSIMYTLYYQQDILEKEHAHDQDRTISIPVQGVSATDSLTKEQKTELKRAGSNAVNKHIKFPENGS